MTAPSRSADGRTEYRLDELRLTGEPLGEGGSAQVWRCTTGDQLSVAFKRYDKDTVAALQPNILRDLIAHPHRLPEDDRKRLLEICAWPYAVVVDKRSVIGLLMPLAPGEFFLESKGVQQPRAFTRVAVRKEDAERRGFTYFDFPHKIARLGQLLVDLQFLHANEIVVGDLQPNNILTTDSVPVDGTLSFHNYFLDCDSFTLKGRSATPRLDPLSWRTPYPSDTFSDTTDMFKFALLTLRCLAENLAATGIDYREYRELLPGADFRKIDRLLTSPQPDLTSSDLRALALAWQSVLRADGRTYRRTDTALREPWDERTRAAHFAAIAVPEHRTDTEPIVRPGTETPAGKPQYAALIVLGITLACIIALLLLVAR